MLVENRFSGLMNNPAIAEMQKMMQERTAAAPASSGGESRVAGLTGLQQQVKESAQGLKNANELFAQLKIGERTLAKIESAAPEEVAGIVEEAKYKGASLFESFPSDLSGGKENVKAALLEDPAGTAASLKGKIAGMMPDVKAAMMAGVGGMGATGGSTEVPKMDPGAHDVEALKSQLKSLLG